MVSNVKISIERVKYSKASETDERDFDDAKKEALRLTDHFGGDVDAIATALISTLVDLKEEVRRLKSIEEAIFEGHHRKD